MFKINEDIIINEDGKPIKTYGITCNDLIIKDVSIDKQKVETLIDLCNKNQVSPIHLEDIIDDFLVDLQV